MRSARWLGILCALTAISWIPGPASAGYGDALTPLQQESLARAALQARRLAPDSGHGPSVYVRIIFPPDQTGLFNIDTVSLIPTRSGAHFCQSIAVKEDGNVVTTWCRPNQDVRPWNRYDVVVIDSRHDRYLVGRVNVSGAAEQTFTLHAPMLTPTTPTYHTAQPRLGVMGETVTPALLQSAGLRGVRLQGVLLLSVLANSAAQRAGLRAGDIITALDGREIVSMDQLVAYEATLAADAVLRFGLLRDGRSLSLNVALGSINGISANFAQTIASWAIAVPALGMRGLNITPQLLQLAGHAGATLRGVEIYDLSAGGPASAAGLRAGDVIVAVNGTAIASIDDLLALLRGQSSVSFYFLRASQRLSTNVSLDSGWQPPVVGPGLVPPATPRPRAHQT